MSRPDWQGWAEEHGCTFTEEAPELVGKWLPPFDGDDEKYTDVVSGTWSTLEFTAFTSLPSSTSTPSKEVRSGRRRPRARGGKNS